MFKSIFKLLIISLLMIHTIECDSQSSSQYRKLRRSGVTGRAAGDGKKVKKGK